MDVRKGILMAVDSVVAELKAMSVNIKGKE